MDALTIRLEMAGMLRGTGVEFGAGANPFPGLDHCNVRYADRWTEDALKSRKYFGDNPLTASDLISDLEEMDGIEDESLDFVVASHVIEHTRNPAKALLQAHRKLKDGGQLVLIVPDKPATFDRNRTLTTFEHILADYHMPSRERDFEHYLEFFTHCFPQDDPVSAAKSTWEIGDDIHFHTWTFESFGDMARQLEKRISCEWSRIWSHPRLSEKEYEFYYVLEK